MKIRKIKRKYLILSGGVILAFLIVMMQLASGLKGVKVSSLAVEKGGIEDYYTEEGILKTGAEYQMVSKVTGPVKAVLVSENTEVKKGDLLLVVDERDLNYERQLHQSTLSGYQAQLDQNQINQMMSASPQEYLKSIEQELASSQAQYQATKSLADAMGVLFESGNISQIEWEQTQAEFRSAQSVYTAAKNRYDASQQFLATLLQEGIDQVTLNNRFYESMTGELKSLIQSEMTAIAKLDDQIEDCNIVAECDGIVMSLPAKDLSMIQAGQVAAVINSSQEPVIEVDVLTSIEPYLSVGAPVLLTRKLRNQDYQYTGTISEIYGFANQGTSALGLDEYRVRVKVTIDPYQEIDFKPGYEFKVRFVLFEAADELIIPANALFQFEGQNYVYVIEDRHIVKRAVSTHYQSASMAVVSGGLEEGEKIITNVDSEDIYEGLKVSD